LAKARVPAPKNLKRDLLMEQYISTSTWMKDRSRSFLTWLSISGAAIAIVLTVWLIWSYRAKNAAESLAEAFRYHDARVANPIPPGEGYAFTTEDEKHRRAYEAFQKAANDYPSYNGEIARYHAAMHQLYFEPEKAEVTLNEISQKDSEVGAQARLALAQRLEATAKYDQAIAELQKLKAKPFSVPPGIIDINMARIYEAQGKTKEAADLYFSVASNKDWQNTKLGSTAVTRLTILAPDRVDKLPPPEQTNPLGGMGGLGF
jgi:tetratricopeptide (TPR) repeat protein